MTNEIMTTLELTVDEYAVVTALVEEQFAKDNPEFNDFPPEVSEALYTVYEKLCAVIGTHPVIRLLEGFSTDV